MSFLKNNDIINYFQSASTLHYDLKSFGTGEDWEIDTAGNTLFPALFLEQPFQFSVTNNLMNNSLNFLVLDRPDNDETDETNIIHKTREIATDVVYWLKNELEKSKSEFPGTRILDGWDGISLTEFTDTSLAGWRISLQIESPLMKNRCDLPFSGYSISR